MTEFERLRSYAIGSLIVTLLDNYPVSARLREIAKTYNTMYKKHQHFLDQVAKANRNPKSKLSDNAKMFGISVQLADLAWADAAAKLKNTEIEINTIVRAMFYKNIALLQQIYGLSMHDIPDNKKIETGSGLVMRSINAANIFLNALDNAMENNLRRLELGK